MWSTTHVMWTYLTLTFVWYGTGLMVTAVTLEDRLSPNLVQSLRMLCPKVDICNPNATTPEVVPNGRLDNEKFISTCFGCSCHEDCHAMLTCCFPGRSEVPTNNQTIPANVTDGRTDTSEVPANNQTIPANVTDGRTDTPEVPANNQTIPANVTDGPTDRGVGGKESTDDTPRLDEDIGQTSADVDSTPDEVDSPTSDTTLSTTKTCIYTRTGTPEASWVRDTPAIRMVSKPPPGGCKSYSDPEQTSTEDESCGSGPTPPWGDLYPVYSNQHDSIYINEQCARCHGVNDSIHWTATLFCVRYDQTTSRYIPVSENFDFLRQNVLANHCFVYFVYQDTAVMDTNRCFVDTIPTCRFSVDDEWFPETPGRVSLTPLEVLNGCHSDLNSPFPMYRFVYKNVFCAMCNDVVGGYDLQQKDTRDYSVRGMGSHVSYLIDTTFLQEKIQDGTKKQQGPYQEVCLRKNGILDKETCRELLCPSGQVRNAKGTCRFVSRKWYVGSFSITIKLTPTNTNGSVLEAMETDSIIESIKDTNIWPSHWKIFKILLRHSGNSTPGLMAIEMRSAIVRPDIVVHNIRTYLTQPWVIPFSGTSLTFEQSFLEYKITHGTYLENYVPRWKGRPDKIYERFNISDTSAFIWPIIYNDMSFNGVPYLVGKPFTCPLVTLFENEYYITEITDILENKLTGSVMFDREFELVDVGDGRIVARVCLTDTPYVLKTDTSGAPTLSYALLLITIYWFYPAFLLQAIMIRLEYWMFN